MCESDNSIPDIIDLSWLRQLFTHKYRDEYLEQSAEQLNILHKEKINGQVISYLVKELCQNIEMFLENIYAKMTKRWIFQVLKLRGFNDKAIKEIAYEIFDKKEDFSGFYEAYEFYSKTIDSKIKRMFYLNKLFVSWGIEQFALCPQYSTRAKYITIDTDILHAFVGSKEKVKIFGQHCDEMWRQYVRIKNKWFVGNKKFDMMIKTDGIGVSVILYKWVQTGQIVNYNNNFVIDDNTKIIGIDPGRKDVITCCDENRNVINLSNGEYYESCKFKERVRKINKKILNNGIEDFMKTIPSIKTDCSGGCAPVAKLPPPILRFFFLSIIKSKKIF